MNRLQDKSYFLGALRTKMTELTSEVARLGREAEAATKEQSTYLAYDKRVKELAEDVTAYQVRNCKEQEVKTKYSNVLRVNSLTTTCWWTS